MPMFALGMRVAGVVVMLRGMDCAVEDVDMLDVHCLGALNAR